ncbi:MAG: hypothetical protein H6833_00155 [Planctomycetes bacterium]|nr:hypothetical protein [Planctomycetota bacterium]
MKNIMIVDSARNCVYEIYAVRDSDYDLVFPTEGQEIEFIELLKERNPPRELFTRMWSQPVAKPDVRGIHGTLFYGMLDRLECWPDKKWRRSHRPT